MSFICKVGIGYFDPAVPIWHKNFAPHRPVTLEEVAQLQSACHDIFQMSEPLADHLTEPGLLLFQDTVVTRGAYQVACTAHEMFGMVSADFAHHDVLFPRTEREVVPFEKLLEVYRETMSHLPESEIVESASWVDNWQRDWHHFQHDTINTVRNFLKRSSL